MKILLLIFLLLSHLNVNAQKKFPFGETYGKQKCELPKETILEQAQMEFIYNHLTLDPEINKTDEEYDILMVGKTYCLYKGYFQHRLDSVLQQLDRNNITNREYFDIYSKIDNEKMRSDSYIITHNFSGKIEVHENMTPDYYLYEEPLIDFKWKLVEDTRKVCGHTCNKATCTFRGRKWAAWYAVDIPQSQGPWKFSGLPGMILLIEDSKREHVFTAISIRTGTKNCLISQFDHGDFKTNRKWFNKAKKDHELNFFNNVRTTGVTIKNADGSDVQQPKKRPFVFNPIEKE